MFCVLFRLILVAEIISLSAEAVISCQHLMGSYWVVDHPLLLLCTANVFAPSQDFWYI